jgi:hypothetical protein
MIFQPLLKRISFLCRLCLVIVLCFPIAYLSMAVQARAAYVAPVHVPAHTAKLRAHSQTVYINESFTGIASTPNAWYPGGTVCLTAGTAQTPLTSIPACGSQAPLDAPGSGVLDLTVPSDYTQGYTIFNTPIPTGGGIVTTFTYYSYDSSTVPGDGLALVFGDASIITHGVGGCCGSLDYAPASSTPFQPGLANGYLAVGLDENGYWTCACYGKTGGSPNPVPNIISVRGSYLTTWNYLLSSSINGRPAQLPFPLTAGKATVRPTPLTFSVTLTAAGILSLTIDRHNGKGPQTYIPPTNVIGLIGEPAVPANVYLGFTSSQGASNERHEISNVLITSAN